MTNGFKCLLLCFGQINKKNAVKFYKPIRKCFLFIFIFNRMVKIPKPTNVNIVDYLGDNAWELCYHFYLTIKNSVINEVFNEMACWFIECTYFCKLNNFDFEWKLMYLNMCIKRKYILFYSILYLYM